MTLDNCMAIYIKSTEFDKTSHGNDCHLCSTIGFMSQRKGSRATVGCQIARLRISIEENRRELLQLGEIKPLTDPEVVKLSQQLDLLLNEYDIRKREFIAYWGLGAK